MTVDKIEFIRIREFINNNKYSHNIINVTIVGKFISIIGTVNNQIKLINHLNYFFKNTILVLCIDDIIM